MKLTRYAEDIADGIEEVASLRQFVAAVTGLQGLSWRLAAASPC
jgi:hypothetical protein